MNINWFPGHMTKAVRSIQSNLKLVDSVIYVLDARAIKSCMNPILNNICNGKEILYLINKVDLVNGNDLKAWENYFIDHKLNYINCIGTQINSKDLIKKLYEINEHKIEKSKLKGITYTVKAMVVGIPNSGKSTIINSISKKTKAFVGNKAGITRGIQWINIENIYLLDTPGTLWGKINDQQTARNLAYIGSINDDILDFEELAYHFILDNFQNIKNDLENKYNISDLNPNEINNIIIKIAERNNYKLKGNNFDFVRTSKKIITDFRKGNLGKIMLDKNCE